MEGEPRWHFGVLPVMCDLGPPRRGRRNTGSWAPRPNRRRRRAWPFVVSGGHGRFLGPWTQHQCLMLCELRVTSRDIKQSLPNRAAAPAFCPRPGEMSPGTGWLPSKLAWAVPSRVPHPCALGVEWSPGTGRLWREGECGQGPVPRGSPPSGSRCEVTPVAAGEDGPRDSAEGCVLSAHAPAGRRLWDRLREL